MKLVPGRSLLRSAASRVIIPLKFGVQGVGLNKKVFFRIPIANSSFR